MNRVTVVLITMRLLPGGQQDAEGRTLYTRATWTGYFMSFTPQQWGEWAEPTTVDGHRYTSREWVQWWSSYNAEDWAAWWPETHDIEVMPGPLTPV